MEIPPRPAPVSNRRTYVARPPKETRYDRLVKKRKLWMIISAGLIAVLVVSIIFVRIQDHQLDKLDEQVKAESDAHNNRGK
jgi:hypothetical protein